VLNVLAINRPLRISKISLKAKTGSLATRAIIEKLVADGLVEEKKVKDASFYCATVNGKEVLIKLKETQQSIPSLRILAT
jgi:predicted transcriptional regulator